MSLHADVSNETFPHTPSHPKMPRIHVIGLGNIGKLFAHSLARLSPPPPITLLLHRAELVEAFSDNGWAIDIITNEISHKITGFDIELLGVPCEQPITNLIVATKATQTLAAMKSVHSRLTGKSSILFAQNGKGTTEEVTTELFPDPETRPTYLSTVVWHGIHSKGPFTSIHAGIGHISVAAPKDKPQARYLLESMVKAPALNVSETTEEELLAMQLEKLVLNAVLNPLTAIFRILNGELVHLNPLTVLWCSLTRETAEVVRAWVRTQDVKDVEVRFEYERIATLVKDKCEMTGKNKSSMLQDVEAGRELEIKYINGWVVARGTELGMDVKLNLRVMELLKNERRLEVDEVVIEKEFGKLE